MASKLAVSFGVVIVGMAISIAGFVGKIAMDEADKRARAGVSDLVNLVESSSEGNVRVTYGSISNSLFDNTVTVEDVAFKMVDGTTMFTVDSVGFSAEEGFKDSRIPHAASLSLRGVEVIYAQLLRELEQKTGADFSGSPFNAAFSYDYNSAGDVIHPIVSFSGEGFADLDIVFTLSNVRGAWNILDSKYTSDGIQLEFDRDERRSLGKLIDNIRINGVSATYTNNGEFESWLEEAADSERVTVEDFKASFPDIVEGQFGEAPYAPDILTFLNNPENITVTLNPKRPVSQDEFGKRVKMTGRYQMGEVLEGLDVTVKANQVL